MNTSKFLTTGCALAVLTVPLHANALTAEDGMNACTKAMINDLSTEYGTPLGFRMDSKYRENVRMKRLETFHLDALRPGTDEVVGRYDCVVSNKAEVVELVMLPLSAEDAKTRAWKTK